MQGSSALAASPAVEGALVFGRYNVFGTVTRGPQGSPRAGTNGVAIGRFGWMGQAGVVLNERTSAADMLGIVLPQYGPGVDWRVVFYDEVTETYRIREGLPVPLLAKGGVWAKFPNGAYAAQPVYANPLDGTAISGYSLGAELTQWSVIRGCAPGQLAIIST